MPENIRDFVSNADEIIKVGGLLLVLIMIYFETAVFLGMVLSGGDYMLFATGVFCGSDFFDISAFVIILLIIVAAVLGDSTGYLQGKWLGKRLFFKGNSKVFKSEYLLKSNRFYQKYGVWAFIMGRFMPIIRTFMPILAGASGIHFKRFLLYDSLGAIIWVSVLVSVGLFFGKEFPEVINYIVYILIGIVIIASVLILKLIAHKK